MKLGSILGALSPGLSATGLFGNSAQGTGLGMLGAMSPLLALLLHKKKKDGDKAPVMDPNQINVTNNPLMRPMTGLMGPPPGSVAPPFGMGQQPPFGRY